MGHIEPVSGQDTLSRRKFIITGVSAAGGLALGFAFPSLASARPLSAAPWSNDAVARNEINTWIVIDPHETITIRIPHAEMGQGAGTSNPMLVAEELECDWAKIKGEFASPNRNVRENNVYKDQNTVGSRGAAQDIEPPFHLRTDCGRCLEDQARQEARDQIARSVQADRQAIGAPRYASEGEWRGEIRHRYQSARHGLCRHHVLPRRRWNIGIGR